MIESLEGTKEVIIFIERISEDLNAFLFLPMSPSFLLRY